MWRRQRIALDQMPDYSPQTLSRLTDEDLYTYLAGWNSAAPQRVAAQAELDRRQARPARMAAWLALGSLVATIIGWFIKN
jgi:hypothetical protein